MSLRVTEAANDENSSTMQSKPPATAQAFPRRALGDVSPNVKGSSPITAVLGRKTLTGSPLKRSFTAAMQAGEGFKYLKKRKLSGGEALSQIDCVTEPQGVGANEELDVGHLSFNPVLPNEVDDVPGPHIPVINETSPTVPNTPSDKYHEDEDTQNSSAEHKSFSSLINYDPSSQTSAAFLQNVSYAEMLRLRLRVAMYKVRTNQIDVPFTALRVDAKSPVPSPNDAVEAAVAQLRKEAQEVMARGSSNAPKLLPAPVLRPTAYSSRMIYSREFPSSPPVPGSPDRLPVADGIATPYRAGMRPHSSSGRAGALRSPTEQELTSSVVKGRVAEGLLGLRNAL